MVCFNKKDDGTYEAELDEAWWWGGGHNDGGTMRQKVPEEWLDLPYDELLESLVTLVRADHYGFTAEHLRRKEGLREFLGFRRGSWRQDQVQAQGRQRADHRRERVHMAKASAPNGIDSIQRNAPEAEIIEELE